MNRAKLLLSLAINEQLLPSNEAAEILMNFAAARNADKNLTFDQFTITNQFFSQEQLTNINKKFRAMRVKCKQCETKLEVADLPIQGNWSCPNCGSVEFNLIRVTKIKPTEKQPPTSVPQTVSDSPISQLYKSVPGESPYMDKTSVKPINAHSHSGSLDPIKLDSDYKVQPPEAPSETIDKEFQTAEMEMSPMSFEDDDILEAPADDDEPIDMTVADGYLIQEDSFDVKDTSKEKVLIAKDDVLVDSEEKVKIKDDNASQLIGDENIFTPADNAQTLLQARRTTDKLPASSSGISNRTAIEMNGQEVIHKGITPESLEKGLPEGAILDGFEILGILGRGGMGIVYNGHDLALNRRVAIKVLSPNILQNETQIKRFEIEAQACAALEHQNVVNIYRFGTIYSHPYIVMQFVDGKSLNDIIKEDGALPVEQVIDYLMQAARGLNEAHHRNIIHRDIKPDNLLVDNRGVVKILDFGLAKQTTSDAQLSQSGYFLGTPAYISPEQASGDPADLRADVYSLGISAFQMLTGKLPFCGTAAQVVTAHLIQELPSITELNPECPLSLEAVINKMSAKSPDERYQSMDEVIEALEFVQKEVCGEIVVDYPKKKKSVLVPVLLVIVVLLIGAGVGLYFMGILDPIIAKLTGKQIIANSDNGNNGDSGNGSTTNGNSSINKIDNSTLAEQEKQKAYMNLALKIIATVSEGFWTDDFDAKHEIDKEKFSDFESEFMNCLGNISDETERLGLKNKFLERKTKYTEKWAEIEKKNVQDKLGEFVKSLQKLRTDSTSTIEDIEENLSKIDEFIEETPDSATELDGFIKDLEKIKENLIRLDNLNEKSKDEKDLKILLNYLEVLGDIVKNDAKDFKFEDRDDVKAYKYNLTKAFEEQILDKHNAIDTIDDETELDNLKELVDDYATLDILNPKEKQKYDFVLESIENRRKDIKRKETSKTLKEDLIQEIEENLIEQDLEKLQILRRKINRQETDYPEMFDDSEFKGWVEKLDSMIAKRKTEEEEFLLIRETTKKFADKCDAVDINDKTKISEMRLMKQEIEEFVDSNKDTLKSEKLKKESDKLVDLHKKCIEYLRIHTVEILTEDKENGIPWQLEKAGSFKGELFNMHLEKMHSKFAWRQPAKITAMQYVKTGNSEYIVTGSTDKTIRMWDMKTLTEVRILKNESPVTALAYRVSKNKDIIVFAGLKDGTIAVWNPIYSKVKNYSTIHTAAVTSIVLINNMALSSAEDKTVVGWSYKDETLNMKGEILEDAELTRSGLVIKHPDIVYDVDVSTDKNLFATACGDQKIRIYNMNGALVNTIKGFFGAVYSVAFEPLENRLIAAGGEENNVKIFRIEGGDLFAELKGHKHYVTNVQYNGLGKLVSTSIDRTSILWNIENREPGIKYPGKLPYTDFVFTSDNHIIFSDWGGGFCKFRFSDGQRIIPNNFTHKNSISGVVQISKNEFITTSVDGEVYVWNRNNDSEPKELTLLQKSASHNDNSNIAKIPVTAFTCDKTGKYGIFGRFDGSAFLVELATKNVVKRWNLEKPITGANVVIVENDKEAEVLCVFGMKGGQIVIKSLNDTFDKKLKVKGNTVSNIAVSSAGLIAVSGFSSEVEIYDLVSETLIQKIDSGISNSVVSAIAFSNSGNIAIGYDEQDVGIIRIFRIADKSIVTTYSNLENGVVSIDFVINDSIVFAVDGTAKLKAFKINDDGSNAENFSANIGTCGDIITTTFIDADFTTLYIGTSRGAVLTYKIEKD